MFALKDFSHEFFFVAFTVVILSPSLVVPAPMFDCVQLFQVAQPVHAVPGCQHGSVLESVAEEPAVF
jgi:hypothetical protein